MVLWSYSWICDQGGSYRTQGTLWSLIDSENQSQNSSIQGQGMC